MWSNVISIGKEYEREIEFVLGKLNGMKELSCAVEESENRLWIYLACSCDVRDKVENALCEMLQVVFLSFLKLRFFLEKLPIGNLNYAKCVLLSSILHFDSAYEENIVAKTLCNSLDYNIDGLFNFRLKALKEAWSDIVDVSSRLLDGGIGVDDEIFDIATFIAGSEGKRNVLLFENENLKNLTERKSVEIVRLYEDEDFDLLNTIIKQKPAEIRLNASAISSKLLYALKKVARVVEIA